MDESRVDPGTYLRQMGQAGEGPHDVALAALMLAALDHPGTSIAGHAAHLGEIARAARTETQILTRVEDVARAIATVMVGQFRYEGDRLTYDDPQNADLIRVIERRRGLPVALGILYIHAARAAGCQAQGLNTPGHFLIRMARADREVLVDPFNGGSAFDRERLNVPPRTAPAAESERDAVAAVSDADVLLRLQNNLKIRASEHGDHARALVIAERMTWIAPRRADVWFELAHLSETAGILGAARAAYVACLTIATPGRNLHNEAALALNSLKRKLN